MILAQPLQYLLELIFFSSVDALYHTLPDSFPDKEVSFLSVVFSSSGYKLNSCFVVVPLRMHNF